MQMQKKLFSITTVVMVVALLGLGRVSHAIEFWRSAPPVTEAPTSFGKDGLADAYDMCPPSKGFHDKLKGKYDQAFKDCSSLLMSWGASSAADQKCNNPDASLAPSKNDLAIKMQNCFWALGVPKNTGGDWMSGAIAELLSETAPDPSNPIPNTSGNISNYVGNSYFPMNVPLGVGAGLTRLQNKVRTAKHNACEACGNSTLVTPDELKSLCAK